MLDDGANMSISNELEFFIKDSLSYLPANQKFKITGISGIPHKIVAFGILQIKTRSTLTNKLIEIQVIAAYTPSIKTTIVCRHDIMAYGNLTCWNNQENLLDLSTHGLKDYLTCDVIQKRKYLKLELSNEEPELTIHALDHNLAHMVASISINSLTCEIGSQANSTLSDHHAMLLHNMLGHASKQIIKNSIETGSITANISPLIMKHLEMHSCPSCALSKPGRKR